MKKRLTIAIIGTALAATASRTAAEPKRHFSEALPPDAILTNVQLSGLYPTSRPYKRGPYYVLHAVDRSGSATCRRIIIALFRVASSAANRAACAPECVEPAAGARRLESRDADVCR